MTEAISRAMMPAHATNETAIAAVEAHAKASIIARVGMALERPRDMDVARDRLQKECARPRFAECARFSMPRGGTPVTGFSIRFAEEAIRALGNIHCEVLVISDDDAQRIVSVRVTDLERNVTHEQPVVVPKYVERRSVPRGAEVIRMRVGADGQKLYVIRPSDEEMLQRQNSFVSRALRTQALRHVPGWLLDECEEWIVRTQENAAAKDPDAERRRLIDAFAKINVAPAALKEWLGHGLDVIEPAEVVDLRALYQAIADGHTTFREALAERKGSAGEEPKSADGGGLRARAKARKASADFDKLPDAVDEVLDDMADRKDADR